MLDCLLIAHGPCDVRDSSRPRNFQRCIEDPTVDLDSKNKLWGSAFKLRIHVNSKIRKVTSVLVLALEIATKASFGICLGVKRQSWIDKTLYRCSQIRIRGLLCQAEFGSRSLGLDLRCVYKFSWLQNKTLASSSLSFTSLPSSLEINHHYW